MQIKGPSASSGFAEATAQTRQAVSTAGQAPREISGETRQAVRELNQAGYFGEKNELTFVIDRVTRRPLLRVVNRETREVVMQVPPEYAVRLAQEQRVAERRR